jgi:hypothetical protein
MQKSSTISSITEQAPDMWRVKSGVVQRRLLLFQAIRIAGSHANPFFTARGLPVRVTPHGFQEAAGLFSLLEVELAQNDPIDLSRRLDGNQAVRFN